ncbi:MAG: hypothetical protein HY645_04755 [Acidobacteria bacterium]|nr:hypothetical protein [Acidobacteriota bacterium]
MNKSDIFANIRSIANPEALEFLDQVVLLLPHELRYRLKQVMDSIPPEGDNLHRVLRVVASQWRTLQPQQGLHIVLVGAAETGKASLLREIERKQVHSEPIFSIIDIQELHLGYGGQQQPSEELSAADLILFFLDGTYGISEQTRQMYEQLLSLGRPILVVLNKMDLVANPRSAIRQAREQLGAHVFAVSVPTEETVQKLLKAVVATHPPALYPLAQYFPDFRRSICDAIVTQSAFSASVVGGLKIPFSDFFPLLAIQVAMILKIARAFGHRLNLERARELLPLLGAGGLVRLGSHNLQERFPQRAGFISVSMAGIWTFSLGRLAVRYFEKFSNRLQELEALSPDLREAAI